MKTLKFLALVVATLACAHCDHSDDTKSDGARDMDAKVAPGDGGGGGDGDARPPCTTKSTEVCDGVDNDCNGIVDDEFELHCERCAGSTNANASDKPATCVKATIIGGAWSKEGAARNLLLGDDRGIALPPAPGRSQYIWIANSSDDTVSKLRVSDGVEVGRFAVGDNPSRTAVDGDGNAWVAMRGNISGSPPNENVVKIDGSCTPTIKPPQATRECIVLDIADVGNLLRGVAVDPTGDVWIGSHAQDMVFRLDGRTGLKKGPPIKLRASPYGLAIDENGYVWVSAVTGEVKLSRIDPVDGTVGIELTSKDLANKTPYGIASDGNGHIWLGSHARWVLKVDNETGKLVGDYDVGTSTRGVAIDQNGDAWAADSSRNALIHISKVDGKVLGEYGIGSSPVGVALDHDGNVWGVNLSSDDVHKLKIDGTQLGTYKVGNGPYTYSDMTGAAFLIFKRIRGIYRAQFDTNLSGAAWTEVSWRGAIPDGIEFSLRVRAGNSPSAVAQAKWVDVDVKAARAAQMDNATIPAGVTGSRIEVEIVLITDAADRKKVANIDRMTFTVKPPSK